MLSHLNNHSNFSKSIILTLTLTGLLTTTINITSNDTALSLPNIERTKISQINTDILPRRIARKILRDASVRSGEKRKNLQIDQVNPNTFSNLCTFKFGEFCTKEYNPIQGWVVIVKVKGQSWTYHVNQSSQFVIDPKISFSNISQLPINIANKVMEDAAKRAGVKKTDLRVASSTQKVFGNSCEFRFGEICNKIYKPIQGWEIVLKVKDESWTYHVNKSGSQIVVDPKIKAVQGKEVPQKIIQKILRDAYQRIRLETSGITVVRTVEKTFSNSCVFNFGEICTQQYDPVYGWEVVIQVNREYWTYHVDREGSRMVLDPEVVNSKQ
jgi:uncharacterized protein YcnI